MAKEEETKYQIGKQVLHESDLKFRVTYGGEVFVLKLPNPAERSYIENEIARRLGGMPRSSYPQDHVTMVEATAYADYLVVPEEAPTWWDGAWTCYDQNLIASLYQEYLRFRQEFDKKLRSGEFQGSR